MQPCQKEQNQKEEKHDRRRMKNAWKKKKNEPSK